MLLSFGYRATVEGLPNVQSSSTTRKNGRATSLNDNCTCRVGRVQSIFISSQLKIIPLFRYSMYSVSHILQCPQRLATFQRVRY